MSASASPIHRAGKPAEVTRPQPQEIVISRWYSVSRERLFALWTEPEHIARWWGPEGFRQANCEVDLRPGGRFALDLIGPDGNTYPCRGRYATIDPPRLLVLDGLTEPGMIAHPCGSGLPPRATVRIEFEISGSGTLLTIRSLLASAEDAEAAIANGFGVGWSMSLECIARLIENTN